MAEEKNISSIKFHSDPVQYNVLDKKAIHEAPSSESMQIKGLRVENNWLHYATVTEPDKWIPLFPMTTTPGMTMITELGVNNSGKPVYRKKDYSDWYSFIGTAFELDQINGWVKARLNPGDSKVEVLQNAGSSSEVATYNTLYVSSALAITVSVSGTTTSGNTLYSDPVWIPIYRTHDIAASYTIPVYEANPEGVIQKTHYYKVDMHTDYNYVYSELKTTIPDNTVTQTVTAFTISQ